MRQYKFAVGDKVRVKASKTSTTGCKENAGKIVTIKKLCPFTWAYEVEELDNLWMEGCFEKVLLNN